METAGDLRARSPGPGGRACVIANPAARRGMSGRILETVRAVFRAHGVSDFRITAAAGEEETLARRAIDEGARTLVAVGGDGTCSNVANAILASGADCRLAVIPAGTANDIAMCTGVPMRDIPAAARLALEGPELRIDVGRIEGRHFLSAAGFGFCMAVQEDVMKIPWLRGNLRYLLSTVRLLLLYREAPIAVGSRAGCPSSRHFLLLLSNMERYCRCFRMAPEASPTDGLLDRVSFLECSALQRLRLLIAAVRGTHVAHPRVVAEQGERFFLRFDEPPIYEVDGERRLAGGRDLEVACIRGALRLAGRPGAT